jgi:hypothetical protein
MDSKNENEKLVVGARVRVSMPVVTFIGQIECVHKVSAERPVVMYTIVGKPHTAFTIAENLTIIPSQETESESDRLANALSLLWDNGIPATAESTDNGVRLCVDPRFKTTAMRVIQLESQDLRETDILWKTPPPGPRVTNRSLDSNRSVTETT